MFNIIIDYITCWNVLGIGEGEAKRALVAQPSNVSPDGAKIKRGKDPGPSSPRQLR